MRSDTSRNAGLMAALRRAAAPLAVLLSTLLVAFAITGSTASTPGLTTALAAVTAAAVAATLAMRASARVATPRASRLGHRARQHRESFAEQAEPSHPDTTGRVRARAPGAVAVTAARP